MVADGIKGRIVNISSSVAEQIDRPGLAAYAASKGGVKLFTKASAAELAPHGIRVNAVGPGLVLTNINRGVMTPEVQEGYLARIPLQRVNQPRDIANVVAFLASAESAQMTGSSLYVDGGALISGTGVEMLWKASRKRRGQP
jgi:NAD(P)-dependent dehydrogenase (short-subunit alcohol dehydrogenase family)